MTSSVSGFWSYAHRDNGNTGGRILRLAELISQEFETLTGDQLKLFVDRNDLSWGSEWESSIDDALTETTFFIPIITPLYLKSAQCRREFLFFIGRAESFGVKDLLLPILYSMPPNFNADTIDDEILVQAKKIQWEDWRSLRLEDESTSMHIKAVNKLAERLANIVNDVSERPISIAIEGNSAVEDSQSGFLDMIAKSEQTFPEWNSTMLAIAERMATVGQLTTRATERMRVSDSAGGGATGKLRVLEEFSHELATPAQEIYDLGTKFGAEVTDVNAGVITLLNIIETGAVTENNVSQVRPFLDAMATLAGQSRQANELLAGFATSVQDLPSASRVLRNPYKLISEGVQRMRDGLSLIESWAPKIDEIRRSPTWRGKLS